jgi:hypothetical protein
MPHPRPGRSLGVRDGGKNVVNDRRGVAVGDWPVGDETSVEGVADQEVDGELQVRASGELAAAPGLVQDVPEGFAAAFGELGVQVRQGGIAFCGIDKGGHQPRLGCTAPCRRRVGSS